MEEEHAEELDRTRDTLVIDMGNNHSQSLNAIALKHPSDMEALETCYSELREAEIAHQEKLDSVTESHSEAFEARLAEQANEHQEIMDKAVVAHQAMLGEAHAAHAEELTKLNKSHVKARRESWTHQVNEHQQILDEVLAAHQATLDETQTTHKQELTKLQNWVCKEAMTGQGNVRWVVRVESPIGG